MAVLKESVDLVIDGADFYRSIQEAPRPELKNGWSDFTQLAIQQARSRVGGKSVVGNVLYFDPRPESHAEDFYGSLKRRELWFGRLKDLKVSDFLISTRSGGRRNADDPDHSRKATRECLTALADREYSPYVLFLCNEKSPLVSHMRYLQDSKDILTELILPPDENESGGLTHSDLKAVRLCGPENEDKWREYELLKQDSEQLAALWKTRSDDIHQVLEKLLRSYSGRKNRPIWLKSLEATPASDERFLLQAKMGLRFFFDAIRKDNRRLADTPYCVTFCLEKAIREVAVAELSAPQSPQAQAPVYRWIVTFHRSFHSETEKWPRPVQDELIEEIQRLRERGPQLERPLVKSLVDGHSPVVQRLRLDAAGGAWRVVFAREDDGSYLLLAGGKKSGDGDKFYRDVKETARKRYREYSK